MRFVTFRILNQQNAPIKTH